MRAHLTTVKRKISVLSSKLSETQRPISMSGATLSVTKEKPELAEQRLLVTRALQGDEKAFGSIVDQYSTLLLRTATMIVADRHIAEDVVQDTLIQAWYHLPDLREAGALHPWLIRMVVNQSLHFKRFFDRKTHFVYRELWGRERKFTTKIAEYREQRLQCDWDLAHTIENLSVKQRVVIVLQYYNGMTLSEIAQVLQTSENTLKKRSQAALNSLRSASFQKTSFV